MKFSCYAFALFLVSLNVSAADDRDVYSPNHRIHVRVSTGPRLFYQVGMDNKPLLAPSEIGLQLKEGTKPANWSIARSSIRSVNDIITSPVPEKRRYIPDRYNELTIRFQRPFSLVIRVYDDGVAYRFRLHFKDSVYVETELANFTFPEAWPVVFPLVVKRDNADIYHTSFEELYQRRPVDSITANDLCFTPVLVQPAERPRIVITESDLEDYPGMFLRGDGTNRMHGAFAPYPKEEKITEGEFPQAIVTKRADYLAHTPGNRSLPWRVLLIAENDAQLPANDLVYRLASPSRIGDASWVKPGKATDEWIIGINLFNVPFRAGINTATYKYYIDFAKRFGFDRIMMDAGWSDYGDLFKINPALDMDSIAAYAKQQHVGLSLWTLSLTLERQLEEALQQFNKWGVDFIMTDFMDRDDQKMVNFYYRIAEACARHRIMIMYHGAFKPAGFNRTFPNAVTREGILGSEFNIWSDKPDPEHDLLIPFIRMTAGPLDYEPGILDNATQKTFRPISEKVMSQGTRCHQAAMFVVYDSPMQVFSGNPSQGLLEPEFMELLGSIPTTWDTTIIPDARIGDYIITARRKGNDWYIGAMTDWSPRVLSLSCSFLPDGKYKATICRDGVNADRYPSDYILEEKVVSPNDTLTLRLAPGGGYLLRLRKQ